MSIVQEQSGQNRTAEGSSAPAPAAEGTRRDIQRAVLHELIVLATECANREAELDRELASSGEEGAKKQQWARSELNRKFEQVKGQVQRKHDDKLAEIEQTFQQERTQLEESARAEKAQIDQTYEA